MAKAATKTSKPAAPKKATAPAAKPAAAKSEAKAKGPATATIKFDKTHHGGKVRGAVNGQRFEFDVGKDVQVTAAQLSALQDSGAKFEIVTPLAGEDADEGSSASSTLTGTATRAEEPKPGATGADGELKDPPELKQTPDSEIKTAAQDANASPADASANA